MKVTILGAHNCESQDTRFVSLLIDDKLALDAGGLTAGLSFSAQQRLEAILLTHQHYDHIRDVPAIAMNLFLREDTISVYSIESVRDSLVAYFMNGTLYPNFLERPEGKPTVTFHVVEPGKKMEIAGYSVLATEVYHSCPAVGYQITAPEGKTVFYTGDTGQGLTGCWEKASPHLLVIEVTSSDRYIEWARTAGHLTPGLLKEELLSFQKIKGYLPEVLTVHMNPALENEITSEIAQVAKLLGASISLAYEGMQVIL